MKLIPSYYEIMSANIPVKKPFLLKFSFCKVALVLMAVHCLWFFCLSGTGRAETELKTQDLKESLSGILENRKKMVALTGIRMITDGDIIIEPSQEYHAITFPHVAFVYPNGSRLDIGMIAANAVPTENEDSWKITLAIPRPIVKKTAAGITEYELDIGSQRLAGILHVPSGNFIKMDGTLGNVRLTNFQDNIIITVKETDILLDFDRDEKSELWNGTAHYKFEDIRYSGNGDITNTIGSAYLRSELRDLSFKSIQESREEILNATSRSSGNFGAVEASALPGFGILGLTTQSPFFAMDFGSVEFALNNVDLRLQDSLQNTEAAQNNKISLNRISASLQARNLKTDKAAAKLSGNLNALNIKNEQSSASKFLPENAEWNIIVTDYPAQKVLNNIYKRLTGANQNDEQKGRDNPFLEMLAEAGSKLLVQNASLDNDFYGIRFNGKAQANLSAAYGGTAQAVLTISNLDSMVKQITRDMQSTQTEEDKNTNASSTRLLAFLTVLQIVGKKDGENDRRYEISVNEEGNVILNDSDLKNVMQMLSAPQNGVRAQ